MKIRRLITGMFVLTTGMALSACLAMDDEYEDGEAYLEPAGETVAPDEPLRVQLPDDGDLRPPEDVDGTYLEPTQDRVRPDEPLRVQLPDDDDDAEDEPLPPDDLAPPDDDRPSLNQPPGYDY